MKKKLVIFTGAGISAESGVATFRDSDGLWEQYNVMDVASIDGWRKNRQLVLDFYNLRHKQMNSVEPNSAHIDLAELEKDFDVTIITQNVDCLHEKAGSTNVLHLHGEINKMRTCISEEIYDWEPDFEIKIDSRTKDDEQLRPFIVWFGEAVPNMDKANKIAQQADIFVVIGTSLQVYPAANIVSYVRTDIPIYVVDPNYTPTYDLMCTHIKKVATLGVKDLIELLNV